MEMEDDLNLWKMEDNPKQLKVKAMVVAPLRVTFSSYLTILQ